MNSEIGSAAAERGYHRGATWARTRAGREERDALAVFGAGDRATLRVTLEHWPTLHAEARRWGFPMAIDGTVECPLGDEFVRGFLAGARESSAPPTPAHETRRCPECGQPLRATPRVA
jgi:hypothetical protein